MIRWISFFVAMLLAILPLPKMVAWFWPSWVLVLLIYMNIFESERTSLALAFFLGIVLDLLTGTLLGAHAVGYLMISYLVHQNARRCYFFPQIQQMGVVALLSLLSLLIYQLIGHLTGLPSYPLFYWMPALTNALVWPLVVALIRPRQEWAQY